MHRTPAAYFRSHLHTCTLRMVPASGCLAASSSYSSASSTTSTVSSFTTWPLVIDASTQLTPASGTYTCAVVSQFVLAASSSYARDDKAFRKQVRTFVCSASMMMKLSLSLSLSLTLFFFFSCCRPRVPPTEQKLLWQQRARASFFRRVPLSRFCRKSSFWQGGLPLFAQPRVERLVQAPACYNAQRFSPQRTHYKKKLEFTMREG